MSGGAYDHDDGHADWLSTRLGNESSDGVPEPSFWIEQRIAFTGIDAPVRSLLRARARDLGAEVTDNGLALLDHSLYVRGRGSSVAA